MEMALQSQRPLSCGCTLTERNSLKIKPFLGFFPQTRANVFSQFNSRQGETSGHGVRYSVTTSAADFSRRRQRKTSAALPKGSPPRGFMPKSPVGTSGQRRDQKSNGEKKGTVTPTIDQSEPGVDELELKSNCDEEEAVEASQAHVFEEESYSESGADAEEIEIVSEDLVVSSLPQQKDNGSLDQMDESRVAPENTDIAPEGNLQHAMHDIDENGNKLTIEEYADVVKDGNADADEKIIKEEAVAELARVEKADEREFERLAEEKRMKEEAAAKLAMEENLHKLEMERLSEEEKIKEEAAVKLAMEENLRKLEMERLAVEERIKEEAAAKLAMEENLRKMEMERLAEEKRIKEEAAAKLAMEENLRKLEMERLAEEKRIKEEAAAKLAMEEKLRREEIEKFAEENYARGNKLFAYPLVVKPDGDIEIFLNRSLSTLQNEPDVLVMGAFNDWRWKSFTIRLNKTNLNGDWWSCQLHVPQEAYKIDFVFFNGKDVYDNNDKKDFCIQVEGGMDVSSFDDFLLEEKRRELEKLAKEQAERERQEEEKRRAEAQRAAMEADRAQAKVEMERKRELLQQLRSKATTSLDNVWYIEPREFKGAERVRLYYNKSSGPLTHSNEIWIHGGYNSWTDGLNIAKKLVKSDEKDGDWWYANVIVPDRAVVLDWVFADGPPQKAGVYDNNSRQDFHAAVPENDLENSYWVEEEERIFQRLQEERRSREEAIRAKAELTARLKAETKERSLKRFLLSQKHIVYTEPLDVRAGDTVTIFYNPANTVLNGKSEIWFRGSFNRWTHRNGPLPPQKMIPSGNGAHVKATVKVPLDAYAMDFVFSEREDGGIFDNKNGMDYHIPVFGGIAKEAPMHIVHISVEMAPIAKVGGLGDVVTSLSRAVQDLNHNVDVILPKYDCLKYDNVKDLQFNRSYSWGGTEIKVWKGKVEGLSVYFLEPQNGLFSRGCVYGCNDDGNRFGFFCHAALEFLLQSGLHPDIIHCHDWSSAPVAWLFKDNYMQYGLSNARVVFTIHNLEFGAQQIGKAMAYADKATTVSPTYSTEVAGNAVISPHLYKFHGILNGIDPDIWDPYNDNFIPMHYTSENVVMGKKVAKEALQQRLNLKKAEMPVVGIISRLTHQKGIHLIKHAIWRTLERGGQVVLLGSAPDPRIQNDFVDLANQLHSSHHDRARLVLTYDEPLSHLIYAGADFILVPSIFEPCGLTQLIAMRYGSIPVVRKTGGLYDTVLDVDNDKERAEAQGLEPNGFNFDGADTAGVDYALNRAISAWYDGREWFHSLCKKVMEQDWSWNRPALDYMELYHAARKQG